MPSKFLPQSTSKVQPEISPYRVHFQRVTAGGRAQGKLPAVSPYDWQSGQWWGFMGKLVFIGHHATWPICQEAIEAHGVILSRGR